MTRFQTQAVLRRTSRATPLLLVGITLDNTFYPGTPDDATGPLSLTKGLVALAPLTAVDAPHAVDAAVMANVDAREAWADLGAPVTREGGAG
ncbi:MAG: hypothetical protein NVS9B8_03650 [Candidatus Limnocylindrales bacterium]